MDGLFLEKLDVLGIRAWAEFAIGGVVVRLKLVSKRGQKKEVNASVAKY